MIAIAALVNPANVCAVGITFKMSRLLGQIWFIENKTGADKLTIRETIKEINPDCVWDIQNLSCVEGKSLTSILLKKKGEDGQ